MTTRSRPVRGQPKPVRFVALAALIGAAACDANGQHGPAARANHETGRRAVPNEGAYEWRASNSAPEGCPVRLLGGAFSSGDGSSRSIPSGLLHTGWGTEGSTHIGDDDRAALPDRVTVRFFSYLEDKFYEGSFALPRDSIERLVRDGYPRYRRPGGRETYNVLVAGVAPGGAVAVWAAGNERQTEVFFGQARPVDLDWTSTMGAAAKLDRHTFVKAELDFVATIDPLVNKYRAAPPPPGRWASYRARYRWQPAFEGLGAVAVIEPVQYLNGERNVLTLPLDPKVSAAGLPVPQYLGFSHQPTRQLYEFTFDPAETLAAFAQAGAGGGPIELVFAAPPGGAVVGRPLEVRVRGGGQTVTLQKVDAKVYSLR